MCVKHRTRWSHCDEWHALRDAATAEWCKAHSLHDIVVAWGRLGDLVCYHRHGSEHYAEMGRRSGLVRRGGDAAVAMS